MKVITKEVPVERVVVKEVPVERIVTQQVERVVTQQVVNVVREEVPVEKVVEVKQVVEVPVEKVVEKVVTKEVEKVVEKVVEVEAQLPPVTVVFVHDHTSGPRGAAMGWGLDRFAQTVPHINIKFVPQPHTYEESFSIQMVAGTAGELALLSGWFKSRFQASGGFMQIDDVVRKLDTFNPHDYYFYPDTNDLTFTDTLPIGHLDGLRGPMFGLPYQGNLNTQIINLDIMEQAGIEWPTPGRWGIQTEFLEALQKATNPEEEQWGLLANGSWYGMWNSWGWALADDPNLHYRSADGLRTTMWDSGGDAGIRLVNDLIHTHGAAPPVSETRELAGEFGDPFSAGRVMVRSAGSVGTFATRIKDRFRWSRMPTVEGPRGPAPYAMTMQPHLVTNSAETRGNVEACVEVCLFFAGREVQGRVAIDRGSVPIRKDVLASPEYAAGPPENHGMMKDFFEQPDARSAQMAHPAWRDWQRGESPRIQNLSAILLGEFSIDDGIEQTLRSADRALEQSHESWQELRNWWQERPNPIKPGEFG